MALFVLSLCPFDIYFGVGAFVIGLSQIYSFFSLHIEDRMFSARSLYEIITHNFHILAAFKRISGICILFIFKPQ